jgi:fimbrial chaperone protein
VTFAARFSALALLALVLGGGRATAGDLAVNPVLVQLTPGTASAVVVVQNRATEAARYEVKIVAWDQTPGGEMKLTPTADVVAFPALVSLGPGEKRNIRVGTVSGFGPVEKSFRLFIEELPPAAVPGEQAQVRVLTRVGIPVFLTPPRPLKKAELTGLAVQGARASVSLRNRGTVHVRPSAARLIARDRAGETVHVVPLDAWYVLAGGERAWEAEIPAVRCGDVRAVTAEVALQRETLRTTVETPAGACAP